MAPEATAAFRFASPVSLWSAAAAPAANCLKSSSNGGFVLKKVCVETPRNCRPQQQRRGEGHALPQSDPNKELAFHGFVNLFSVSGMKKFRRTSILPNAQRRSQRSFSGKVYATAVVIKGTETYQLPTWAEFEIGAKPVFWETQTGLPPTSGEMLTIYFNPAASQLIPRTEYGIGFNGGFNQPIMCGGEPRIMTKRERGAICEPFYIMKINVPVHALSLEFSFTDGTSWDGPYKLKFEIPAKWRNQPVSFFNEGLADTLSREGACESAIFPEPTFVQDRCSFPANLTIEGGDRCELDLVPGCTDPENPFYNPLANVEDGSCPYISDSDSE